MDSPTDRLMMKNKALYYLVLFISFGLVIEFVDKLMLFITGKLGNYIPYALVNHWFAIFILYVGALYIFPLIISFILLQFIDRR